MTTSNNTHPEWCDRGHPSTWAVHSSTLLDHTGESGATVSVRVIAWQDQPPAVMLFVHNAPTVTMLDAETAEGLALVLDAVGVGDLAGALGEAVSIVRASSDV